MSHNIKLGCVEFLNSQPLIYPLDAGLIPHSFEIEYDVPSNLVAKLKAGNLDIALASTGALLELDDDYSFIPGIGICSDGPVRSVLLCHAGPIRDLKVVHQDPASVTSNLLAKIILNEHYGVTPEFRPPGETAVSAAGLNNGEGCVLIGDRALREYATAPEICDLGSAWKEFTGLPFIYALWIGRREFITDEVRIPLYTSMLVGSMMIEDIVDEQSELPLSREASINYLRESIIFPVDELAEAGLDRYLDYAKKLS